MMPAPSTILVLAPGPDTPVINVAGIGPSKATKLGRLGILTVGDLLMHLPRRYEDTRDVHPLRDLQPSPEVQTVRARVRAVSRRHSPRKHIDLVEATLEDNGAVNPAMPMAFGPA